MSATTGSDPPAVLFHYLRKRKGERPTRHLADFAGVLQADAYSGFNPLPDPGREPGPITPALCWAHRRRKFFERADLKKQARSNKQLQISSMALEAVKRIDALFDIERAINGWPAGERLKISKRHWGSTLRPWLAICSDDLISGFLKVGVRSRGQIVLS